MFNTVARAARGPSALIKVKSTSLLRTAERHVIPITGEQGWLHYLGAIDRSLSLLFFYFSLSNEQIWRVKRAGMKKEKRATQMEVTLARWRSLRLMCFSLQLENIALSKRKQTCWDGGGGGGLGRCVGDWKNSLKKE